MNENLIKLVVELWERENDPDMENFDIESYTFYAYGYGDSDIEWLMHRFNLFREISYLEDERPDAYSVDVCKRDYIRMKEIVGEDM